MTRDATLSGVEPLAEVEVTFQMDEDVFRGFYDRTARAVWAYLSRATGDNRAADDLLQEAYYRFLRSRATYESEIHRRQYLFRIAVNLVRDHHRRRRFEPLPASDESRQPPSSPAAHSADRAAQRIDLNRAMARLTRRERDLLWLAYAQGSSHEEIAASLGLKTASIKSLLFRARRRLASLLGHGPSAASQENQHRADD